MAIVKPRIPGFQDGGNAVEPTTGNDVPVGSLPNEVADDIPAKLSEGEFVLPADVVRFIGLERLMKMRDEAKEGLRRMAEIGQMGNAEEVGEKAEESYEEGEEEDDDEFESNIDSIMSELENEAPENEQTEKMMAVGGYMSGTDVGKAPNNPTIDVRFLRHADGRMMYITYIGGRPMTPVPEGFREITREEAVKSASEADKAKQQQQQQQAEAPGIAGVGTGGATDGGKGKGKGDSLSLEDLEVGRTISPTAVKGAGVVGTVLGFPGAAALLGGKTANTIAGYLSNLSGELAGKSNLEQAAAVLGVDPTTQAGRNAAMAVIDDLGMSAGLPGGGMSSGQFGASTAMADYAESGAAGSQPSAGPSTSDAAQGGSTVGVDALGPGGAGPSGGNDGSLGVWSGSADLLAKGGLVSKRQKPMKKPKGKGLAAR